MFEYPVVFVDIETTGGSYKNSRVLEVAAIRIENGEVVREFSSLINPETYIPSAITELTGINERDVLNAPLFSDIADELNEVMDGAVFIAHNVRFDYSFLKQEFLMLGVDFSPKLLCTVRLSRALYPQHQGHSLAKLIERHDIPVAARHRALDDARAILYFSQLALGERGQDVFDLAIRNQLKSQYLPPNLDIDEINSVDNIPGVYVFKDEMHQPIYIGKSINLKKRILSHFSSDSNRELKIAQSVHHVEVIPTGSEFAALILESKLIKEKMPLFNRMLRRVTSYSILVKSKIDDYSTIKIQTGNIDEHRNLDNIYGLYTSRTKAKKHIEQMVYNFGLCPKLMGIEKTTGACFSYSLGKCSGACVGIESADHYNMRFEIALGANKLEQWPYKTPIVVPVNLNGDSVVISNWIVQGYLDSNNELIVDSFESNFDVDEYKIIRRFINENKSRISSYGLNEVEY